MTSSVICWLDGTGGSGVEGGGGMMGGGLVGSAGVGGVRSRRFDAELTTGDAFSAGGEFAFDFLLF